ncbi:unnamed protein product [Trifolium pratense]|uniref:Uncharacterized protein n=1 Tax=Trifolium pratense TaxID=57577 RepID=A0ACB0KI33_TRIPR|nr:unnamed protein product [Trifolium pratense]
MASTSNVGAPSNPTVNGASPSVAPARVAKNEAGNKTDPAWEYATSIDIRMCSVNYVTFHLNEVLTELSIIWLELIEMSNVKPCTNCPPDLRKTMLDIVNGLQVKLLKKIHVDLDIEGDNRGGDDADLKDGDGAKGKRKSQRELPTKDLFKRGLIRVEQTTVNGAFKKDIREDACKDIDQQADKIFKMIDDVVEKVGESE